MKGGGEGRQGRGGEERGGGEGTGGEGRGGAGLRCSITAQRGVWPFLGLTCALRNVQRLRVCYRKKHHWTKHWARCKLPPPGSWLNRAGPPAPPSLPTKDQLPVGRWEEDSERTQSPGCLRVTATAPAASL